MATSCADELRALQRPWLLVIILGAESGTRSGLIDRCKSTSQPCQRRILLPRSCFVSLRAAIGVPEKRGWERVKDENRSAAIVTMFSCFEIAWLEISAFRHGAKIFARSFLDREGFAFHYRGIKCSGIVQRHRRQGIFIPACGHRITEHNGINTTTRA